MKKAFLVEYCIRTRVVVEVADDFELGANEFEDNAIYSAAREKILSDPASYVIGDNIVTMEEDLEMPYDPKFDGK